VKDLPEASDIVDRRDSDASTGAGRGCLRVVFAGGGTGGHLIPGAAIAEALRVLEPSCRCCFLVTGRSAERHCSGALAGFETMPVPALPLTRAMDKLRSPIRAARTAARVLGILRSFRPQAVVGLGGCNSVVPVLMARALGIRTLLIEGNAIPGRAVRLLAPLADCLVVQWPPAATVHARKVLAAGNPVRMRLFETSRETARRRLGLAPDQCTLLALGGSQGALALNQMLLGALRLLQERPVTLQVIHLTGVDHLHQALEAQQHLAMPYRPIGFLDRVEEAYVAADLVVSRAGCSTLAYLTALGLPAVLIPLPHAADGHQEANARVLAQAGAALVVSQSALNEARLAGLIERLVRDGGLRARIARQARALGRPQAAMHVAAELAALAGFSSRQRHQTGQQAGAELSQAA
jgi:UDP-N-acetylglucosamine--N-acetylmuramyl-(pentapeptide) pyrophosphoryl-undecaprenol N-acetylglucosamine transferase